MASFHPNQPDGSHKCEHCGAHYELTWQSAPMRDADTENCHCCRKEMAQWNATSWPIFKLIGECPGDEGVKFL